MNHLIAEKKIKSCMCLPRAKPLLSQTSQLWQMSCALLWCGGLATTIELLVCLSRFWGAGFLTLRLGSDTATWGCPSRVHAFREAAGVGSGFAGTWPSAGASGLWEPQSPARVTAGWGIPVSSPASAPRVTVSDSHTCGFLVHFGSVPPNPLWRPRPERDRCSGNPAEGRWGWHGDETPVTRGWPWVARGPRFFWVLQLPGLAGCA